jgi:hypothetical protein
MEKSYINKFHARITVIENPEYKFIISNAYFIKAIRLLRLSKSILNDI